MEPAWKQYVRGFTSYKEYAEAEVYNKLEEENIKRAVAEVQPPYTRHTPSIQVLEEARQKGKEQTKEVWKQQTAIDGFGRGMQRHVWEDPNTGISVTSNFGKDVPELTLLTAIDKAAKTKLLEEQWNDAVTERMQFLLGKQEENAQTLERLRVQRQLMYDIPETLG